MPPKGKGRGKAAASSHQLATSLPVGEELVDLRKKTWHLGPPIGSGGFGLIYLADDEKKSATKDKSQYVIKVEPHGNGPLYCEVAFYQRAARQDLLTAWKKSNRLAYIGIPAYIAHGLHKNGKENLRFMVMPRFGSDLHNLWLKANKKFKRSAVCQLAIELINSLEYMHENEYVHADIKGANVLCGYKDPNQIYLVDFGLAYRYLIEGKHKEYREDPKKAHDGTIEYTSRDAHLGVSPSRRADMEILGYVLLHWLAGRLPWEDNLTNKNYVKDQKIKSMSNVKKFVADTYPEAKEKKADEIEKYLSIVSKMEYEEKPDYNKLRKFFKDALKSMHVNPKAKIDFESEVGTSEIVEKKSKRKTKPLASASNLPARYSTQSPTSSQSDQEPELNPKKRTCRTPARQKKKIVSQSSSEDEDMSTSFTNSSESTPARASVRKKVASNAKKPVSARKKPGTRRCKKNPEPEDLGSETEITESSNEIFSDENEGCIESFSSSGTSDRPAAGTRGRKDKISTKGSSTEGKSSEEVNVMDCTFDVKKNPPVTRSSPRNKPSTSKVETSNPGSLAKSRYSMAPLHTTSVLGKNDVLTGEHSGKHPVIIRRRKKNRPKSDAVTQTTPSLRRASSRV